MRGNALNTQQHEPKRTSLATYAIVAVLSAVIGFGAIYAMVDAGDNGTSAEKVTTPVSTSTSATPADGGSKPTRLSTGAMATFVFKDTPLALPEVSFNDGAGQARSLKDWAGKVVLLNIWATWCGPCRKEMPHLDQLKRELGSDTFDVVAVSIDRGSPDKSRAFLAEVGAKSLALYHDPQAQLGFTLKAIGMPATLLIDAKGREVGRLVGPAEWHSEDAKRLIRAELAKLGN